MKSFDLEALAGIGGTPGEEVQERREGGFGEEVQDSEEGEGLDMSQFLTTTMDTSLEQVMMMINRSAVLSSYNIIF